MHCEKAEMLLAQMIYGELDSAGPEGSELAVHLAGCRACAELLNDMRVAAGLVREGLTAGTAPVLSAERQAVLLNKAAEINARRPPLARRHPGALGGKGRIVGLAAASAAAVLLAGVLITETFLCTANAPPACHDEAIVCFEPVKAPMAYDEMKRRDIYAADSTGEGPVFGVRASPAPTPAPTEPAPPKLAYEDDGRRGGKETQDPAFGWRDTGSRTYSLPATKSPADARGRLQTAGSATSGSVQSQTKAPVAGPAPRHEPAKPLAGNGYDYESSTKLVAELRKSEQELRERVQREKARPGKDKDEEAFERPAPIVVAERMKEAGRLETHNDIDRKEAARNSDDAISDIPLGASGTVGSIGVGGGAMAGRALTDEDKKKAEKLRERERIANQKNEAMRDWVTGAEASRPTSPAGARPNDDQGRPRQSTGKQSIEDASIPYSKPTEYQAALERECKRLTEDLANAEYALKDAVSHGYRLSPVNIPDVRTKVVDVRSTGNVALGAGSDSGIKEGTVFLIYRKDEYIGKIRVTTVWNDFAGGQIIEQRKPFMPDDSAMSSRGDRTASASPTDARAELGPLFSTSPHAQAAQSLVTGLNREDSAKQKPPTAGEEVVAAKPFIVLTPEQAQALYGPAQQGQPGTQGRPVTPPPPPPPKGDSEEGEATLAPAAVFKAVPVNPFVMTKDDRFSTFGLDVDTASYSISRRYIRGGYLPPVGAVRMEEFVNAFDYNYPCRTSGTFSVIADAAPAPFGQDLTLLKVGIRGKVVGREGRKPANLVFVVDASGSMDQPDRMPLVKYALGELVGQLGAGDRVTLVAYGTKARLVLEGAPASEKKAILDAIDRVQCEGSTNLSEGLSVGYRMAAQSFVPGGVNRVILCSDGAANIGVTAGESILDQVRTFRDKGVTCTCVGFGAGTYNDVLLEKLADSGDGSYVFVDSRREARRVFVEELSATLQTIAKDAKIQVEFDPRRVRRYRLVGYENRDIADEKFRDDTVDAGEVGSGQSATALYELELQGPADADLGTVYVRYKNVDTGRVEEISQRLEARSLRPRTPESDPRYYLAACAAEFAELLRDSEHAAGGSFDALRETLERAAAQPALRYDPRVVELLELVRKAKGLPRAP
ncbi:MAG TPA: von Willebrand factor type A domain-containing protein [Planctomycetota bacterium]|nr:von Willebrand factor type A domain-containing protein [Planctomycetota bacterium]